jgi:DtxR family Mn-dependent transcriptional regulator
MHEPDFELQDLEEVAEELWTLGEEGLAGIEALRAHTRVRRLDRALAELQKRGHAVVDGDRVRLTDSGRGLAELMVRRHRLAETLFAAVLHVEDDGAVNRTACLIEHVLDATTTDPVCTFLGHPGACPHGKPIPPGDCCRSFAERVEPLVQPLDRLGPGGEGRVVFVVARDRDRVARLSTLGVIPGAVVRIDQLRPVAVLTVGETTLAVEPEVAAEIYVKRVP